MATDNFDQKDSEVQLGGETKAVMTSGQKRFYASEQCTEARIALQQLVDSIEYNTESSYFTGNPLHFVERHLHYLSTHPTANLQGYLTNLKLMTNTRQRD